MKTTVISLLLLGALVGAPGLAAAHCDAVDGPVASSAVRALETGNVNLVLPYVPAESERELAAAFTEARQVRATGPEARALADRYFMETAVRLHRAGEKAPYTGLKPAGQDFGPAIPAAERALEAGTADPVLNLLARETRHGVGERLEHALAAKASKTPATHAEVAAARERVHAELGFIGYVEGIFQALHGGAHAE